MTNSKTRRWPGVGESDGGITNEHELNLPDAFHFQYAQVALWGTNQIRVEYTLRAAHLELGGSEQ